MWSVDFGDYSGKDTMETFSFQTFLVPIAIEERRNKLGVEITEDVIIVEQDEQMKRLLKPTSGSIEFLWKIEMDSSSIDTVGVFRQKTLCNNSFRCSTGTTR